MSAGAFAAIVFAAIVGYFLWLSAKGVGWRKTGEMLAITVAILAALAFVVFLFNMLATDMWPWEPGFWEMAQ